MDGFDVAGPDSAVRTADEVITATGRERVVGYELIETMPDGVLLANAGHADAEIDVHRLEREAPGRRLAPSLRAHELPGGRTVFLLAKGRIVNLAGRRGYRQPHRGNGSRAHAAGPVAGRPGHFPMATSGPAPSLCPG